MTIVDGVKDWEGNPLLCSPPMIWHVMCFLFRGKPAWVTGFVESFEEDVLNGEVTFVW